MQSLILHFNFTFGSCYTGILETSQSKSQGSNDSGVANSPEPSANDPFNTSSTQRALQRPKRSDWCRWPVCQGYLQTGVCPNENGQGNEGATCDLAHIRSDESSSVTPDGYVRVCFDSMGLLQVRLFFYPFFLHGIIRNHLLLISLLICCIFNKLSKSCSWLSCKPGYQVAGGLKLVLLELFLLYRLTWLCLHLCCFLLTFCKERLQAGKVFVLPSAAKHPRPNCQQTTQPVPQGEN